MRSILRAILIRFCAVLLGLATMVAATACVLLYTDWGRAQICSEANVRVSRQMMGSLQISSIDEINWPLVTARGVKLVDPTGVPAIDVEIATVELDTDALLDGRFAFVRAEVRGGIVRVTEDAKHRLNMEETFRGRQKSDEGREHSIKKSKDAQAKHGPLDLRNMVTSNMTLVIGGGSLPDLRLTGVHGIMRVQVLDDGDVYLTFDNYRGHLVRGLPTGKLLFREVKGYVQTDRGQLLHFDGAGKSDGEPVAFSLNVRKKPSVLAEIHAHFERVSEESLSTLAFAATTKFSKGIELHVDHAPLHELVRQEKD